ncbi:MAG: hypothetical protein OEZ39_16040 [Gammaproteobacteria bacterium]|nr:hypothetical protein [Gammaproteobacteria bacterium]MDH5653369.1 hypothetical protein [Gammaproteobacteria bacterium]
MENIVKFLMRLFISGIFLLPVTMQLQTVNAATGSQPVITDIQAKLFYSSSGTFSEDVLKGTDFILWNVVIGEGSAKGSSRETLVIIEVSSTPDAVHPGRSLEFRATYQVGEVSPDGKPRMRNVRVEGRRKFDTFGKSGKKYFGFWLAETGCVPVQIQAKINGGKMTKVKIPFACGE